MLTTPKMAYLGQLCDVTNFPRRSLAEISTVNKSTWPPANRRPVFATK